MGSDSTSRPGTVHGETLQTNGSHPTLTSIQVFVKKPDNEQQQTLLLRLKLSYRGGSDVDFKTPIGMRQHDRTDTAELTSKVVSIEGFSSGGAQFLQGLKLTEANGTVHRLGASTDTNGLRSTGIVNVPASSELVGFQPCHGGKCIKGLQWVLAPRLCKYGRGCTRPCHPGHDFCGKSHAAVRAAAYSSDAPGAGTAPAAATASAAATAPAAATDTDTVAGTPVEEDVPSCVVCCDQASTAQLCHENGTSHEAVCGDCADLLKAQRMSCPICRMPIVLVVKTVFR